MLNKSQTLKLARALNLFAQELIESGATSKGLEKDLNTESPLPVKPYKLVKHMVEGIIGEYMASRNADKFLAVVYESTNPRVPDTAFGPFASTYEANMFCSKYEVLASQCCNATPGIADFVKFRDPTFPVDAFQEAMAEREAELQPAAKEKAAKEDAPADIWCQYPNPFWRPPATTADVPAKLQKSVEAFLRKAAQIGKRLQSKRTTEEQAKGALKEEGVKLAEAGGGWGALSYAFWRLRNDGVTVETIHAYEQANQDMSLMTVEILEKFRSERLRINELDELLAGALYGWMGIAGWAP